MGIFGTLFAMLSRSEVTCIYGGPLETFSSSSLTACSRFFVGLSLGRRSDPKLIPQKGTDATLITLTNPNPTVTATAMANSPSNPCPFQSAFCVDDNFPERDRQDHHLDHDVLCLFRHKLGSGLQLPFEGGNAVRGLFLTTARSLLPPVGRTSLFRPTGNWALTAWHLQVAQCAFRMLMISLACLGATRTIRRRPMVWFAIDSMATAYCRALRS